MKEDVYKICNTFDKKDSVCFLVCNVDLFKRKRLNLFIPVKLSFSVIMHLRTQALLNNIIINIKILF